MLLICPLLHWAFSDAALTPTRLRPNIIERRNHLPIFPKVHRAFGSLLLLLFFPFLHSSVYRSKIGFLPTLYTSSTTSFPCSFSFFLRLLRIISFLFFFFFFFFSFDLPLFLFSLSRHLSRWFSPPPSFFSFVHSSSGMHFSSFFPR